MFVAPGGCQGRFSIFNLWEVSKQENVFGLRVTYFPVCLLCAIFHQNQEPLNQHKDQKHGMSGERVSVLA